MLLNQMLLKTQSLVVARVYLGDVMVRSRYTERQGSGVVGVLRQQVKDNEIGSTYIYTKDIPSVSRHV